MKQPQPQILDSLKNQILPSEFDKYIKPMVFNQKYSKPDCVVFNVSNEIIARFISTKYSKQISQIFEEQTGIKPLVIITSKQTLNQNEKKPQQIAKPKSTLLINSFSFENFIVGDSNRFAYTCSKYVAQNPGKEYNPLFIYGPSGLGKTHLLQSIGNFCIENGKSVICVTSEQFMNDYTFHIRNLTMDRFTAKYRNCDILLIDDVQFFGEGSKEGTRSEFFHTFNELKSKNSHIVMTSDRPPKSLKGFEDRLLSRFESGLITYIDPPELDTKINIIRKKSQDNKIVLDQKVVEYIAINMGDNIREIESVLNRLNAFSTLMRTDITLEFTKNLLQDQIKEKKENISIDSIIETISKELNVKPSDLKSKARNKKIVEARRIAIYLSKKLTMNSMPNIAGFFGLKDHSAVSHNIKKINDEMANNNLLKIKIEELENKITQNKDSEFNERN